MNVVNVNNLNVDRADSILRWVTDANKTSDRFQS